ncbi:subunit of putative glutamyl-tRNA amidotransferase [Nadsonia fulvescens var. elongata DSM 6958]|uniref:Glutamyl-tRNA(Gln) amidotransferase subunit A, mitochondrial n=1 Tax=Nadsonia fulvescens var. elongata DSM 6958 TaxID=857566 RepID=A0A1E3PMN1_9ASCO|nr:subunit of putative glutamyl-tRNA amidotransferase [Nadsonia fulvescens var. elongata DSM 6958]
MNMNILKREAQNVLNNIRLLNPRTNAFISLSPENSVLTAVEASLNAKVRSDISGKLLAVKDNFCTQDLTTTCGSKILESYRSPYEAQAVRLLKEAGVVVVGKANMDEFGMGTHNVLSAFGPVTNPRFSDNSYSAGGSSGGSAAAVSADMCHFALGTDTGGSVRLPGAYCGVVGFKPSYGLISRDGVVAYAQSLDTVGILAKDVGMVRSVFNILNAYDPKDPTSIQPSIRKRLFSAPAENEITGRNNKKWRIGLMTDCNLSELSPVVKSGWMESLSYLHSLGHEIVPISIPSIRTALPAYYIIASSEASSNLARYDGIRYGSRANADRSDESRGGPLYGPTRQDGFGEEVRNRIILGNYNLTGDSFNSHFLKAQEVRRKVQNQFNEVFSKSNILISDETIYNAEGVDFLVTPCTTSTPPELAQVNKLPPSESYINDVLTVPASLAGIPAVSVPWKVKGETIGIQVIGQYGDDLDVLKIAQTLQSRK